MFCLKMQYEVGLSFQISGRQKRNCEPSYKMQKETLYTPE